jgi:two-component system copper resistance phosphate regulon response regulator CusR
MRLLFAEDQPQLRRSVTKALTAAGYSVDAAADGAQALDDLDGVDYDAIVLDVMMPRVDGLTVLRTLRSRGDDTPVLLLTARDAIDHRVEGLDAGADDYLVKPFAMEELLARLRGLTRRKGSGRTNVFTLADLTVDTAARSAVRAGMPLALSAREYALLEYLIRNKGIILSREQIENNLWNYDYAGGTNVVDVYISYLRKKLELPGEQKLLHTVRGMGWVLKEDV